MPQGPSPLDSRALRKHQTPITPELVGNDPLSPLPGLSQVVREHWGYLVALAAQQAAFHSFAFDSQGVFLAMSSEEKSSCQPTNSGSTCRDLLLRRPNEAVANAVYELEAKGIKPV